MSPFLTMFSHLYVSSVCQNAALCGNGLTLYHTISSYNNIAEDGC